MKRIGVITIGQSPRKDLIPYVKNFFSSEVVFEEVGVLDNIEERELEQIQPEENQTQLTSRMRDGTSVKMAEEKILPYIQKIITEFNQKRINLIVLACTGEFPQFQSQIPVIYPDFLMKNTLKGLFTKNKYLAVIAPMESQKKMIDEKWNNAGFTSIIRVCSPYDFDEYTLIQATDELEKYDIDMILLDCIGYTEEMKHIVKKYSNKYVLLSRNIVFSTIAELC